MGCVLSKPTVYLNDGGDQELRSLNAALRRTTSRVISSLAADDAGLRSLSFKSLLEATDGLADIGSGAFVAILEFKDDIARNPDLLFFVNDYFKNSVDVLRFFTALRGCLARARASEAIVRHALERFSAGDYAAALSRLREFHATGHPFTESFVDELRSVSAQQRRMLDALHAKKRELDEKLGSVRAWRKVWSFVYAVAFAAALICSVVLAAVSAPPAATAAAAAVSAAAVPLEEWLNSLWDEYELGLEREREAVAELRGGTFFAIHELESIRLLVERLEVPIGSLLHAAGFAAREEETAAVRVAMEEIQCKLGAFTESIQTLEAEVERRSGELRKATAAVVKMVNLDFL